MNFTRNDEGDDDEKEEPHQPKPRINAIKVLKVDLEEEEESESKWLKNFLLTVSAQVIIQFLYGSCSRRRKEQKEKITEDESKSGGDESNEDEEDEFELIQEENPNPEETPQDSEARGSQEDPKERRCESKEEGRILLVTKFGEVYHLQEDCEKTKGYKKYQRFPCKECKAQSKEILKNLESSSSHREGTALYVTMKDQCYHHPTCPRMLKWKHKSKRVRCLICEGKEPKGQKDNKSEKEPTG